MAMPAPARLVPDTSRRDWTVEELQLLPDDGNRYEIIDGELLVTAAPNLMHQVAIRELVRLFLPAVDAAGLELFFAPTAVRWGPRSEVQPDLLVLPRLRSHAAGFIDGLASLVLAVEVLSPSSARADRVKKRAAYLRDGVREYWVVDCAGRVIERWRPGEERPDIRTDSLTWQPGDVHPALTIDLDAFFRRVHAEE